MSLSRIATTLGVLLSSFLPLHAADNAEDWGYNEVLGWIYTPQFPWVANEWGWTYMFSDTATAWDSQWGYTWGAGWYWASDFDMDQVWVYNDAVGEYGYLTQQQWVASMTGNVVHHWDDLTYPVSVSGSAFDIDAITITNGMLNISVTYSGGCEDHHFTLVLMDGIKESNPPQAHFRLIHNERGDTCEEIVSETLSFDLSSELETWSSSYAYNQIELRINPDKAFGTASVLVLLGE